MLQSSCKWIRYAMLFGLFATISACASSATLPLPMVADETTCQRVSVGPGPEDFVLDRWDGPTRLLISCCDRRKPKKDGNIWYYDISSGRAGIMPRIREPEKLKTFRPHGVAIRHFNGRTELYVILHDPYAHGKRLENAVGVYRVFENELVMIRLLEDPRHLWSPNELSVLPSGDIYLTNDYHGIFDLLLDRARSDVVYYNPGTDKWQVVVKNLNFANGILAERDKVYVTTTLGNRLMEYPRNPDGTLGKGKRIVGLKGGDNITPYGRKLLVCAQYDNWAFIRHSKNADHPAPSVVFLVNPKDQTRRAIFSDDGHRISAASTAMVYDNKLYISQPFDPFMLVCGVPADFDW